MNKASTMPKKAKQPQIGLLAVETTAYWGFNLYKAVFPAGTLCKLATNQPTREDGTLPYFIAGQPSSWKSEAQEAPKAAFDSWHETYGFLVEPNEVVARVMPARKRRK